ncbi:MAG TPA: TonB-dependent receptor [Xanthomonadales bacterium]|nr:TonB-dependent receptor [Xanthomonadales bacterium]
MKKSNSYPASIIPSALISSCALLMSSAVLAQVELDELEEVVVTAQKREQILSDIPMSITVLKGSMLEQQQAIDFQDLTALVPGFSVTGSTPGVTRITLRGINTGGVASTVGVYYDEVPFGSSTGLANGAILSGDFDTFDLARIEVLRGPQGTLYGASSLGGVLKYVPNAPSTEGFEGRVKAGLETVRHGGLGYSGTAVINAPLSDTFAIRVSGFYRYDDGFIDSIGENPIPSLTDPSVNVVDGTIVKNDLNSSETYGGRFSALWTPNDDFSLNLTAMIQDINSDAPNQINADGVTLKPLNDEYVQNRYQDQYTDISYQVYSATMDWDFGPASVQSITSWGDFKQDFQVDAALGIGLTGGPPLASLVSFIFGTPLSAVLPQTTATDKFTQEVRLLSPESDRFEWLLGVYYTDEDSIIDQEIVGVTANTETPAPGIPLLAVAKVQSSYKELAFFGNATWYITDRFDLSFGARASSNDQDATQTTDGPLAGGVLTVITGESSESPFTWSISPHFDLNENASIYARVATGFRPGGPNIVPPGAPPDVPTSYDSDSLTSYEAGYKMNSSHGRVTFDFTAYYLDWEDIQLFTVVNGFGVNANGGTAVSKGAETAISFAANENWTFSANGAYTNAKLTQDTSPQVGGMDGDPLPFVPKWSFGVSADYRWALSGGSDAYVGGTLGYTGDRPTGFEGDDDYYDLDAYTTFNLRTGMEFGTWAFEVYVKNLTDERGDTAAGTGDTPYTGFVELGIIQPRTIGFTVGTSF